MSYELVVADEAIEDLHRLIDSLPSSRRRNAIDGVEAALEKLAANPQLGSRVYLGRPAYHFHFKAGAVMYHWGCTYSFSEEETCIRVTHIFRAAAF